MLQWCSNILSAAGGGTLGWKGNVQAGGPRQATFPLAPLGENVTTPEEDGGPGEVVVKNFV